MVFLFNQVGWFFDMMKKNIFFMRSKKLPFFRQFFGIHKIIPHKLSFISQNYPTCLKFFLFSIRQKLDHHAATNRFRENDTQSWKKVIFQESSFSEKLASTHLNSVFCVRRDTIMVEDVMWNERRRITVLSSPNLSNLCLSIYCYHTNLCWIRHLQLWFSSAILSVFYNFYKNGKGKSSLQKTKKGSS